MSDDNEQGNRQAGIGRDSVAACCNGFGRLSRLATAALIASMTLAGCAGTATDTTNGFCNVSGVQRACHKNGVYKNKYHLNGLHAGTCACQ
jgi:hypothetical protein